MFIIPTHVDISIIILARKIIICAYIYQYLTIIEIHFDLVRSLCKTFCAG